MPTIKDVAAMAGVSVATVSRYINESGYVSENTKEKIAKAVEVLDYTPNEVARSLYKKTSKLVGLLVPRIDNPYFNNIITGMEHVCNDRGYHLIISNVSKNEDEKKYIESFMTNNVAGIISAIGTSDIYEKIKCPIVGVDRASSSFDHTVVYDEENGGKMAAELIVEGNAKRVLIASEAKEIKTSMERLKGTKEVLERNGVDYDVYYTKGSDFESAMALVHYIDESDKKYDSIIACNDLFALCVALHMARTGVKVPEDVQIVGYDDTIFSKLSNPQLSTIRHDGVLLGEKSAEMLIDMIEKKEIKESKIQLFSSLVKNGSTRSEKHSF